MWQREWQSSALLDPEPYIRPPCVAPFMAILFPLRINWWLPGMLRIHWLPFWHHCSSGCWELRNELLVFRLARRILLLHKCYCSICNLVDAHMLTLTHSLEMKLIPGTTANRIVRQSVGGKKLRTSGLIGDNSSYIRGSQIWIHNPFINQKRIPSMWNFGRLGPSKSFPLLLEHSPMPRQGSGSLKALCTS